MIDVSFKLSPGSSEDRGEIQYTYEIVSISKEEIQFKFNFEDPLDIMASDRIVIKMYFGQFELGMETETITDNSMTKQLPKGGLQEVKQMAGAVQAASTVALVSTSIS